MSTKNLNEQIREALRHAGVHLSAAELGDSLDADVANVSTRLSNMYRLGELVRRVGEGSRFEYALPDPAATRPAPKTKPRRGPPAPVNVPALEARVEATLAEAQAERETRAEVDRLTADAGADASADVRAAAAKPQARTVPARKTPPEGRQAAPGDLARVVSRFLGRNGVPAEPALQARAAGVIDQISLLAEDMAATEADPDLLRQLLLASRSLRAVIAPELEHNA